ncbi:alginate export family protein [Geobacter hydrogenophilus]|uniref:Outer membrane channel protein n=1 Tax=Geobacter hydrogenophilus TaxID=40983 RepID=A0A9W6G3L1_9BACT|nr:alginate export family protein [Geobacter hydrogenophilus]MBT0892392.1 alginate export family protein [Geobacter hydrogenophilus]GLI39787.1 outer membrane channel protein [Geobacter hydrogenophilus]
MGRTLLLASLIFSTLCGNPAFAAGGDQQIPEQVTVSHWSCKQIGELAKKYDAEKKLPDTVLVEGKPISRAELAKYFLYVIEKVVTQCDIVGKDAVKREDLDQIATLHESLKDELTKYEGYLTRRGAIEEILAKPEVPEFEYKVGVNGFLRGEGVGNFRLADFSYAPGHGEGRFLYRVKPYAYWHPTDYLDLHVEGQGFGFRGGSQEYNRFSLYQGFVEGKMPGSELLALKAGRQEFVYGSAFILGSDAFMDGLTFDALRLRARPLEKLTVDLLGGWYAPPFSEGRKGTLAGGYATWTFAEGNAIEAYGFRDTGSGDHHVGEHRTTWGLRGTVTLGPATLEIEPVYQSGRLFNPNTGGNESIQAYGGHADLSVDTSVAGFHNHFFLSYALGSGDGEAATGVSSRRELSTPTNDSPLFGDMKVIGGFGADVGGHHASGLQIYTLGWGADLTKELNFSATGRYFLANHVEEGFSRSIGLETDFTLTWAMSGNLSVIAGYDHFFSGKFFRDASGNGNDIHYGYLMLQFDLVHQKAKAPAR